MTRRAFNARGELAESPWQGQVVGLARFYGWRVFHAPAGGKGGRVDREQIGAGFPDLVLLREPELIVAELKTRTGRATPAQYEWLAAFETLGAAVALAVTAANDNADALPPRLPTPPSVEAYLWRPDDFDAVLRRLSRGRVAVRPDWAP